MLEKVTIGQGHGARLVQISPEIRTALSDATSPKSRSVEAAVMGVLADASLVASASGRTVIVRMAGKHGRQIDDEALRDSLVRAVCDDIQQRDARQASAQLEGLAKIMTQRPQTREHSGRNRPSHRA
jgi:hypothetical protein